MASEDANRTTFGYSYRSEMLVDVDDSDSTTAREFNSRRAAAELTALTPVEQPGPIVATGSIGSARHASKTCPHDANVIVALIYVSGRRSSKTPSVLLLIASTAALAASHSSPV